MVEVNASDTRNKADAKRKEGIAGKTSNRIKELVTNTSIGLQTGSTESSKQVLIMDEVDGMSGACSSVFEALLQVNARCLSMPLEAAFHVRLLNIHIQCFCCGLLDKLHCRVQQSTAGERY